MNNSTASLSDLAERIAEAIEHCVNAGVARDEIAHRLGHGTKTTLSKWSSGAQVPGAENLIRMTGALGISGHWLLTGEGPMMAADLELPDAETQLYASAYRRLLEESKRVESEIKRLHREAYYRNRKD